MTEGDILELCIELNFSMPSSDVCNSILRCVSVNDVDLPAEQRIINRSCRDSKLVYIICSRVRSAEDVLSLWNTLDDLIRNIRVAMEALEKVK